jgi:hypothetical protein
LFLTSSARKRLQEVSASAPRMPIFSTNEQARVCLARVVGRHDQLRRRVELDHRLRVREPVDQQPLATALGHLHQVVLERALQLLEGDVHAPAVLEAVLGPPEAVLVESLQRLHYAAAGAIAVDGDRVVRRRAQQRLLRRAGKDVDHVAEPCQRARLVPGVGPDPAEAGLGRVFEGEEGDSHRRDGTSSSQKCGAYLARIIHDGTGFGR